MGGFTGFGGLINQNIQQPRKVSFSFPSIKGPGEVYKNEIMTRLVCCCRPRPSPRYMRMLNLVQFQRKILIFRNLGIGILMWTQS